MMVWKLLLIVIQKEVHEISTRKLQFRTLIVVLLWMFSINVSLPVAAQNNQPPTISNVVPQVVEVGQSISVAISYSDPDGDAVTVSSVSDNPAVASVTQSATQTLTVIGVTSGSATITVTVDDGRGGTASASFAVTINASPPTNNPPIINALASQTINVGQSAVVTLSYSDPDGDAVTVSASLDNAGVASVAQTSATALTVIGVAAGTANIAVTVSDDKGGTASVSFVVVVNSGSVPPPNPTNNPPVIAPLNPQLASVGQSIVVPIGYSDPDGDAVMVTPLVMTTAELISMSPRVPSRLASAVETWLSITVSAKPAEFWLKVIWSMFEMVVNVDRL